MRRKLFTLFFMAANLFGQTLPHNLTEEERSRLHEIGLIRQVTDPPQYIQSAPAEFDSVSGIIFSWQA
ncbi:MAG: hypothetical protein QF430_03510, partial [Candidatus Marinimicrobia bacterium]|nr:hypothetical protein [Candidatus Neomarinimicrobiota bacterium]